MKKKCLVIGGGSDIGASIVCALYPEYDITWSYFLTERSLPGRRIKCDLTKEESIRDMFSKIEKLDLLVTSSFPFLEGGNLDYEGYLEAEAFLRGHVLAMTLAADKMENGRIINIIRASGAEVSYSYNKNGRRVETVDENTQVYSNFYDDRNRLVKKTDPLGNYEEYSYDDNNNLIDKDDLSKGEQQLYATALLKALVDESGINFPVFIDSPLQKFDVEHSSNVIQQFYPTISEQVVLFPLLGKELSFEEYEQLKDNLSGVYLIDNNLSGSSIEECEIDELFTKFNKQNYVLAN